MPHDIAHYTVPIAITAAYFALWYFMLFVLQSRTKYRLKREYSEKGQSFDRYFGQDRQMLAADRVVINTQEQMLPFLSGMWLYALFVSSSLAAWLGGAYVVLRAIYPLLLGKRLENTQSKTVFFVTGPCYVIIFYFWTTVVWTAFQ